MIIAVMSDTHGNDELVRKAIEICKSRSVEHIIHCGDIGSGTTVDLFRDIPTEFVFGNCDSEYKRRIFHDLIPANNGNLFDEEYGSVNWEGIPIAFIHGNQYKVLDRLLESGDWRLVCSGHEHILQCDNRTYRSSIGNSDPKNGQITTHLIPGSLFQPRGEKPFLGFCLIHLPDLKIEPISLLNI